MNELLKKYIFRLSLLLIVCYVIGYAIFKIMLAAHYFSLYPCIAIVFFVLGTITILSMLHATKQENRKYFKVVMFIKMIKLASGFVMVALYAILVKENVVSFVFTFCAYYVIYSVFETYISTKLNKNEIRQ